MIIYKHYSKCREDRNAVLLVMYMCFFVKEPSSKVVCKYILCSRQVGIRPFIQGSIQHFHTCTGLYYLINDITNVKAWGHCTNLDSDQSALCRQLCNSFGYLHASQFITKCEAQA